MSELLKIYNAYNDLERNPYFASCYNQIPSNLEFETQLKESRENIEKVLSLIDFKQFHLEPVYKLWSTKDTKDADQLEDYPYQYLFKSSSRSLMIFIDLSLNEITVEFLYDIKDGDVENWIIETNHLLRTKLGETKKPVFKILTQNNHGFSTEEVQTGDFGEINISELYNDDFQTIDRTINSAIEGKQSGLILLHGVPGTGKTSYIKHLMARYPKKDFIFIQNDFVQYLLKPEFISFLLKHRDSVLIIEDAERVIMSRDESEASIVSTILQLTDGLFSDYLNIKIICTFNTEIDRVDQALLRKGRMIARYEFQPLTAAKADQLVASLGGDHSGEALTLAEIFKMKEESFENRPKKKRIGFLA